MPIIVLLCLKKYLSLPMFFLQKIDRVKPAASVFLRINKFNFLFFLPNVGWIVGGNLQNLKLNWLKGWFNCQFHIIATNEINHQTCLN